MSDKDGGLAQVSARPKVNAYDCPICNKAAITRDVDDGVTPMLLGCRMTPGCKGLSQSRFYRVPQEWWDCARFEWYKPTEKQARKMSEGMRGHIQQGGLVLREVPAARTRPAPVKP